MVKMFNFSVIFSDWSDCSGECPGLGTQSRQRVCDRDDGAYCDQDEKQTRACGIQCPFGKRVRGCSNLANGVTGFREKRVIKLQQLTTGGGGWSVDC
jgi:hypothetical protein